MRIILSLCGLFLIAGITILFFSLSKADRFGPAFSGAPTAAVRDLMLKPENYLGQKVTIEGEVIDQCPSTGCFFYFDDAGQHLRVELGDLAQKLPQRAGSRAKVEGQLIPYGNSYQFLGSAVEFK